MREWHTLTRLETRTKESIILQVLHVKHVRRNESEYRSYDLTARAILSFSSRGVAEIMGPERW